MFNGKTPIAKAPKGALVSPEQKISKTQWKKLDQDYKKSEHYKKRVKR